MRVKDASEHKGTFLGMALGLLLCFLTTCGKGSPGRGGEGVEQGLGKGDEEVQAASADLQWLEGGEESSLLKKRVEGMAGKICRLNLPFINTGSAPLRIRRLSFSCGCLHPRVLFRGERYEQAEISAKPLVLKPGEKGFLLLRFQYPVRQRKDSFALVSDRNQIKGEVEQFGKMRYRIRLEGKDLRSWETFRFSPKDARHSVIQVEIQKKQGGGKFRIPKIRIQPEAYGIKPSFAWKEDDSLVLTLRFENPFLPPEDHGVFQFTMDLQFPEGESWKLFGRGKVPDFGIYAKPHDLFFGAFSRKKTQERVLDLVFSKKRIEWQSARVLTTDSLLRSYLRVVKVRFLPKEKALRFKVSLLSGIPRGTVQTSLAFRFRGIPNPLLVPLVGIAKE